MKFFKKAFLLSLVLIAILITLTSCSGKKKVTLSAEKSEISVVIGEAVDLKLSANEVKKYTEEEILSNLDIKSSDDKIVKIEPSGLKAVGIGTADVTATWKEYDGATVTVKVNVIAPEVGNVTYSTLPANIYVGDTFNITHQAGADVTVKYESSNAEVLSVDGNNFEALAKGTVKITATASNGYKETKKEWNVEVLQGEYTITYVLNGGVNAETNPAKYDVRELPLIIAAATKAHKTFLGWTTEENSTNYITEIAAGTTGDITLYAQFADIVHNIAYELDGGILPEEAPITFVEGEGVQLVNSTKAHKVFLGWTKEASSTDYVTEISAEEIGNVTLYANYADITHNILYELDGGKLPEEAPLTYIEGEGVQLINPSKDGYTFLGWTKETGSTDYVTEIGKDEIGEFKVYANWEKDPVYSNIVYELDGGKLPEEAPLTYEEGVGCVLPVPTKDGYNFLGWAKTKTSTKYITEIGTDATGEFKVYAKWEKIPVFSKIVYELNGGTNPADAKKEYEEGVGYKLPTPTKDGFDFLGWTKEESSSEYITEIGKDATGEFKVYAKWEKIPVFSKIVYELNGGTNPADAKKEYEEGVGYKLPTPTKASYKFLGWTKVAESTEYITEIGKDATGEFKVYAQWEKQIIKSAIKYNLDGGVLADGYATEYTEGETLTLPVPTKEGFDFLGWSNVQGGTAYISEIPATATGEFVVYANWKEKLVLLEGYKYVGEGLHFATLDEAIQGVSDGDKIMLPAGEYALSVVINKSIEIHGPNSNLQPTSFKSGEAVINVAKDVAGNIAAKNVLFNGVHLKGTGGGGGIPGVFFQDGGNIETLKFKSCVVSDMNTFIKFRDCSSQAEVIIEDCNIHTIGQFIVWVQGAQTKKVILTGSIVDGSTCGAVTNTAAALFRVRSGSFESYNNYFKGSSQNDPGYFESIAVESYVKYNTFENVTKFANNAASNLLVFDENLYLDANGKVLNAVPSQVSVKGVTADVTIATSEEDRAARYIQQLISSNPDRYFTIEYELNGGTLTSSGASAYDKEVGVATLPTIEKEGYIFLGWYLNGEKVENIPAGTSGNLVLEAKFRDVALVVNGTNDEGCYPTLEAALADVKEGETIKLVAGEYDGDVTINVPNIRIIGPNVGINANNGERVAEAIIKGVFNVTSKAQGLTIDGLSFTGKAKVVYAESVNYDGFLFQNNKVYDTAEATAAWDESRYTLPAFLQFTLASGGLLTHLQVYNNNFNNVSEINILANRCVDITIDGNVFKDFDLDAIRTEGGNCYGIFGITNNVFEQTTLGNGNNGIFLYSIGGANSSQPTTILIKNNSFIKLGKNNGTVFSGAVSAYRFQENITEIYVENNIFDHCYDYLYLRNNGGNATTWKCKVENNQFLGLPTNQYYGSYRGADSENTNPHLAEFTKNYYEDNSGNVITDLSAYASYFKHMASYGSALSAKPGEVEVKPVEFWQISYELNGGSTNEAFIYQYSSINNAPIALPVLTLVNHQFNGWLLNGELVSEIPASAQGDLYLIADFSVLEGEIYNIEFVTNKQNVIWPSRAAVSREEIVTELFNDLYAWAKGNGETRSYTEYETYLNGQIAAYADIKLRNTKLGNYPAEDGSTEFFLNVPEYYQKWSEFFAIFHTAMLAVNAEQSFYTDTYATMVRLYQFISWSSTGQKYFESYLSKMYSATKIPQEIPTTYRGGQVVQLPQISLANGLKFLGWYDNADFAGSPITNITSIDTGDKVFYAKWEDEIKVEKIDVNKINEILLFETHQLVWTITPDNATDKTIEFFSSNESVATVSAKGLITALAKGKTTITIKVYGNRALDVVFELEVYTNDYIDGSYEGNSYALIDETVKLNAEIIRKDGSTASVSWKSLNPEIATVDANGLVTALNEGTAKIVAVDPNNANLKLEFVIVVLSEMPEDILDLAIRSHESNIFTRYDLNIGATYNKDILGSVSKILASHGLVKNNKFYDKSNESPATFGTMTSIEFITVHYTGNMASGADAAANASYFATNGSTSIHYTTGNDGVYYCMDESKAAWHAGDSGALAEVGEFKWIPSGVKVGANDPMYPNFTISNDFFYEINGQKTTIKMPSPWNYSSRGTDHILNADGTISSNSSYKSTAFSNRTPESFINDQSLPFKIVGDEYYMGTTWWCYTQVYEGRICSTGGNRNSIGIESCVNEGSDLWFTWQKTAQLVADIMVRHNLDITRVRGHHFYTAKNCPQPMLENDLEIWYEFLELVEAEYELLTKYSGYEVTMVSNNPDIVDNCGRVIKQPAETTCVTYTITFTKDGQSKSITLASMVKGMYVDR